MEFLKVLLFNSLVRYIINIEMFFFVSRNGGKLPHFFIDILKRNVSETIDFAVKLNPDYCPLNILTIYSRRELRYELWEGSR